MNYFVLATHAVTVEGEWVTPDSVQQADFDSLHCIAFTANCRSVFSLTL